MIAINKDKLLFEFKYHLRCNYIPITYLSNDERKMYKMCRHLVEKAEETKVIPIDWLKDKLERNIDVIRFQMSNDSQVFNTKKEDIDQDKANAMIDALQYLIDAIDEYEIESR